MSNGHKKDQSQENWQRVRALLNEHWDPLGVADQVDDEYDHYVHAICQMLMDRQVSEAAISHHLYFIAAAHMGLTPHPNLVEGCERAAASLVGLRPQFETH
jgi:hypothetical protein